MDNQRFLRKFTQEVIQANQKLLGEEAQEKLQGYHQCILPPTPSTLHEQAMLEARKRKAEEFEIEALENELYLKEIKKDLPEENPSYKELERESEENEVYQLKHPEEEKMEKEIIMYEGYSKHPSPTEDLDKMYEGYSKHPSPTEDLDKMYEGYSKHPSPTEDLDKEAIENEKYRKEHPSIKEEIPEYHPPHAPIPEKPWHEEEKAQSPLGEIEEEAEQNEKYEKEHPPLKEELYTPMITPPSKKTLTDYDQPRLYPGAKPSPKPYQIAPASESLPIAPLSKYTHIESTELPTPMLQKAKTGGFIKPIRKEETPNTKAGLLRMKEIIKDHAVTYINCPGPLKPVMIKRMGIQEVLKIALDEKGIRQVIQEFAEASRIPITGGVFKAVVDNLMITAVITEIGSRFTITRTLQ